MGPMNEQAEVGNEQPQMLVSDLDVMNPMLNSIMGEETTIHYDHSLFSLADNSQCVAMQSGLAPEPFRGAPFAMATPPDLSPSQFLPAFHDVPSTIPLSQAPANRKTVRKSARQNHMAKRRLMSKEEKNKIRAYHSENKGVTHQQIADEFGWDRSTITKMLTGTGDDEPKQQNVARSPIVSAIAVEHIRHHHSTPVQEFRQPFGACNGFLSEPGKNPTREDAQKALEIARRGLEEHTEGLDENEYAFFQKLSLCLSTNQA